MGSLRKEGQRWLILVAEVDDAGQMDKSFEKAKEKKASVIAVRVYNEEDYNELKELVRAKCGRKAVLFDY